MKNTKEYIRRVNRALNSKAFKLPAKTKARLELVMQAEYTKMLEEDLFKPLKEPKNAAQIAREMTAAVPNMESPGARKPVDAIATTVVPAPKEEESNASER